MSTNATAMGPGEGILDGVNATLNGNGNGTNAAGSAFGLLRDLDFMMLELKLVTGAMGIIYLGAHAALRRPPSASPAKPSKSGDGGEHDEDEEESFAQQGLELTDAIVFPLVAGAILVGLYYLIQWLNDPAILNKVLRYYMSTMSIASLLTLYAHAMELGTSFVFPRYWRARDGVLRKVIQGARAVALCDDMGNVVEGRNAATESNPLPGPLALLALSEKAKSVAWGLRSLLTRHWVIRFFVHGVVAEQKAKIKFAHMMSLLLALATALVYFSTSSPFLSNMLGYGMCYGSFLVLSPTDFLIGSLVLTGLFFYDIYMVFFTPYMVTVATKLDVPIKLAFEAGTRKSILGLGDIVIPGMVIGWALRLDLWIFYLRKVKYESTDLKIVEKDAASGEVVTRSETKHREIKPRYANVKAWWGEKLWTRGALFLTGARQGPVDLAAVNFPKTYFYASMVGYALGMMATLAMLIVFKQGQPALLYLVPGVLGSLVVTALARGEMRDMWTYTEDGSLDTMDVVVDLDGDGRAVKRIGKLENGVVDTTKDKDSEDKDGKNKDDKDRKGGDVAKAASKSLDGRTKGEKGKRGHRVFLLSLDAPSDGEFDE